jgi:pectate lyase
MRVVITIFVACLIAIAGVGGSAAASGRQADSNRPDLQPGPDIGREVLAPNDGWAAFSTGTTGGAAADDDHVFTVTNRQELLAALNNLDPTPKIIYVKGTIDANVDDNNQPLTCDDYATNGYTLEAYLAAYDPAVWGRTSRPSGPLEDARVASQQAQQARVRIRVGSNTTLVGVGRQAQIRGAWIDIRSADNIIIRNINFEDTYDCFPLWDPTDGSLGNWNSQYDSIALRGTTHVWVDHNTFADVETADETLPTYFGRLFQVHDGQLDITNASDLVTVSWNRFTDHDKVMLIGSSDSGATAAGDRGKLRVTLHHNLFENVGQRTPRVRFGKVHVYNNLYRLQHAPFFVYSWGVGIESQVYAENNVFKIDHDITADEIIERFNGTAIHESGTLFNKEFVDVLAAYNAANDPDLSADVGWVPTLHTGVQPAREVFADVQSKAGPFIIER